ncbi:MAG: alpha-L-fucosidase [Phycisphaerae bacterium]|nr:alpha-L-fucosidase [Phycisphaerae bacterium]
MRDETRPSSGSWMNPVSRRGLLTASGSAAALWLLPNVSGCTSSVPPHMSCAKADYRADPRKASLQWFRSAGFGLFMHYGLYSQLGRGEWVMYKDKIPVGDYVKLKDTFTAEKFDADRITDLALAAGMKYVNITSRHHDSFCLFRTAQTDYSSVNSPAKRDLVGELAEACRKKKLGLFLYYSYALDWKHPYFFPRDERCPAARPAYDKAEPTYLFRKDEDFRHYLDFVHAQMRELLTQYGPIAGLWLDPLMGYYGRPELFPITETYGLIRSLQPGCLISFKQGANGDEDFVAPERKAAALKRGGDAAIAVWEKNRGKPVEICDTLQPAAWGYEKSTDGKHKTADDVMKMLADARAQNANLLLNTGPLADGSIHPDDQATLREAGRRTEPRSGRLKIAQ